MHQGYREKMRDSWLHLTFDFVGVVAVVFDEIEIMSRWKVIHDKKMVIKDCRKLRATS